MSQSPRTRVLVVDDEPSVLLEISGALKRHYDVLTAQSAEEAEALLAKERVDLLLTDLRLPGKDGLHLLEAAKATNPDLPVVIMSGHGTIEEAVRATRMGAADFVEKPFGPDRLNVTIERALELRELKRENESLRTLAGRTDEMVGASRALEQVRAEIGKVAKSDAKVLITGESGAGKELVARAIHLASARARGPFEKLNCAALPKDLVESELFGYEKGAFTGAAQMKRGRLEAADRGTLFLDEVGDMSLDTQAKFLRAIETGEIERLGGTRTIQVDARIVAATNKNLSEEIQAGRFREDLFYRLSVVPIHVQPLRARREDVPILIQHFMSRFGQEHGRSLRRIGPEAVERLARYSWPGNVRELKNLIERLLIMTEGESIGLAEVEAALPADTEEEPVSEIRAARDRAERDAILTTLRQCSWNVTEAAKRLGMDRGYLHRKIKRYGLVRDAQTS
ncbi:MAG TPA: sigma-54 dependent transcriptional regulator [Candidatus Limnocylindrales bacterium]|nr:sigma-54 dependent transcriptional regulator [Candidatus Limnocylindrales bacterium]